MLHAGKGSWKAKNELLQSLSSLFHVPGGSEAAQALPAGKELLGRGDE